MTPLSPPQPELTREQLLRHHWAQNLRDELEAKGLNAKAFHMLLNDETVGADVTLTAVYSWLSGQSAPSPYNQAFCAHVLKAPAHRLFPLPTVAA